MIKILKTLLITLAVLILVFGAGIYIFLKTLDISKYKPQIIHQVNAALGRNVDIRNLRLSFSVDHGIILGVEGISISDNPEFSSENFLVVDDIKLGINVNQFFTNRRIIVSSIEIKSPHIVLIRDKNGFLNVQKFGPLVKQESSASESSENGSNELDRIQQGQAVAALTALLIKSITVENGTLDFIDRTTSPPLKIEVSNLAFQADNISLLRPFKFLMTAGVFGTKRNISIAGLAGINVRNQSANFKDIKLEADLSKIIIDSLRRSLANAGGLESLENIGGNISITIDEITATQKGLESLSLSGNLTDGKIEFNQFPSPLTAINMNFQATEDAIDVSQMSLALGTGKILAKGRIDDYLKSQDFHFDLSAENIDMAEIIPQRDQLVQFHGKLGSEFKIEGKGLGAPAIFDRLAGAGKLKIKDGQLTNINVLRVVLDNMSMLPDLAKQVEDNLPSKYKDALTSQNTSFQNIDLIMHIKNKNLLIDRAEVNTDAFQLSGSGTVSLDQRLGLEAKIAVPQDLSQSMIVSAQPLQYLLDNDGQIVIPVSVSGRIPSLIFMPDLEYLGKRVIINKGKEELHKVLEKVFGKEETPESPSQSQPSGQTPSPPEKPTPEQELIEGIFNRIFN